MHESGSDRIPLFPLGLVLLPAMPLPLHIFEERYKEMIAKCLENDEPFGVVYYTGSEMQKVGCSARIGSVLKRYEDGQMDIWAQGIRRFLVREIIEEKSYIEAVIDYFDDDEETGNEDITELTERGKRFLTDLADSVDRDFDLALLEDIRPRELSFLIAGSDGFSMPEKQRFLEMRSTRLRLEKSLEALKHIIERIRLSDIIRSIIGSNGHLPDVFSGGPADPK